MRNYLSNIKGNRSWQKTWKTLDKWKSHLEIFRISTRIEILIYCKAGPLLKSIFFTGKIIPESTRYVPNKLKIQNSIRICFHLTRCNVCLRIHNDKETAYAVTLRMSTKRQNKLSQCCTSPETEKNKGRVYSWLASKPVFPIVFSLEKNSIWNVKGSANLIENVVFIMSNKFTRPI